MDIDEYLEYCIQELRIKAENLVYINKRRIGITKNIIAHLNGLGMPKRNTKKISSFFIGSISRGTEIVESDVDLIVSLPIGIMNNIETCYGMKEGGKVQKIFLNGLCDFLEVKYKSALVYVDAPVITVKFKNHHIEILPTFVNKRTKPYTYKYFSVSENSYLSISDPISEQNFFLDLNAQVHFNLKRICWLVRSWKYTWKVEIKGIIIDSLAYNFFSEYSEPFPSIDVLFYEFCIYLYTYTNSTIMVFGSKTQITNPGGYEKSLKKLIDAVNSAIENRKFTEYAINIWSEVTGIKKICEIYK